MAAPSAWTIRIVLDSEPEAMLEALDERLGERGAGVQDAWVDDLGPFLLARALVTGPVPAAAEGFRIDLLGWAHGHQVDLSLCAGEDEVAGEGLFAFDADSTLVDGEGIDELAARAGVSDRVAAITARAMAGELDYADSLHERVALLRGLSESVLEEVAQGLRLNPGVKEAVETIRTRGWRVAVISGGFDFYLREIGRRIGPATLLGNALELENGRLTGRVRGMILDARGKRSHLERLRDEAGLPRRATVAVGDGANDGPMVEAAGLGLAYRPKAALLASADGLVARADLRAAVALSGLVD